MEPMFKNVFSSGVSELIKSGVASYVSSTVETIFPSDVIYLPSHPYTVKPIDNKLIRETFNNLSTTDKNRVYNKVWELAKMEDCRISGNNWGSDHLYDSMKRLSDALYRLGFFWT